MGNKPQGNDKKPVQVEQKYQTITDDEREKLVFEKLLNSLYAKKFDEEELHDVAKDLCTAKGLKETYLSTNWTETLKIVCKDFSNFLKHEGMKKKDQTSKKQKSSKNLTLSSTNEEVEILKSEAPESEEFQEGVDTELSKEDLEQAKFNPDIQFKDALKVKLVISEIASTKGQMLQKMALGPILNTLNLSPKLGLFFIFNIRFISLCFVDWTLDD
jgi:hypothetical protein